MNFINCGLKGSEKGFYVARSGGDVRRKGIFGGFKFHLILRLRSLPQQR